MAGTVMCIGLLGQNRDGTIPPLPQGTGFLVSRFGYVLTASHVVHPELMENTRYPLFAVTGIRGTFDGNCNFGNGPTYSLQLIAFDSEVDLALLKIQQTDLSGKGQWRYIPLGDSNMASAGDSVIVIGWANGSFRYLSTGAISKADAFRGRMEFTTGVDHGMSGAPVLDARGYVIGVVWGGMEQNNTLNFFVPIDFARALLALTGSTK
ncbi:MAG: S1 family peptidase [Usitatibacter sp.]